MADVCSAGRRRTSRTLLDELHMDCRTRSSTSLAPASYLRAFFLVHFGVYLWITSSDCARNTLNDGLGVDTREGESQHFGSPVFNRAASMMHMANKLKSYWKLGSCGTDAC